MGGSGDSDEPPRCPRRSAFWWCLFHGTERNAGLFYGTDKCDNGTINLILEYLTQNGSIYRTIHVCIIVIVLINKILTRITKSQLDDRGTVKLLKYYYKNNIIF